MHQALINHAATFGTLQPDESVRPTTPPGGNWQESVSRDSLSSESRHQLIPATPERAIVAGTAFLTLPMRSIQQAIIQSANDH